jgi:alpha-tubulin suppressor-like RCC1 family protein
MSGTVKTNVFKLNQMYQLIVDGCIGTYDNSNDPGTLWAWGSNQFGQIGDNTVTRRSSPVQVPGTQWIEVSSGRNHTAARKSDGTLWAWGYNLCGELGDGTGGLGCYRSSPAQVPGTQWAEVHSGADHTLARKSNGTLWAWGGGIQGQLGNIIVVGDCYKSSPVQIPGTQWTDITAGTAHTGAIKSDGTLWVWGSNGCGTLGVGNINSASSPIQIPGTQWVEMAAGRCHSAARKSDGTLWSWGFNYRGQLGNGTITDRSSPIQIPGIQWTEISAGQELSAARKSDGTLWTWGRAIGIGQSLDANRSSPTQVLGLWVEVGNSQEGEHVAARKSDGTMWSWGYNQGGALGENTNINRSSPIQTPGTQWSHISNGGGSGHRAARKSAI